MPLISVIVPVYNAQAYLRNALDSILAQTFTEWEAILVNDGSTDSSLQICKEYATADSRFKVVNKENGGTLSARKTGLENSSGEYIANLDNDDVYHPQFLEKLFAVAKHGNYDLVWCGYNSWKSKTYKWSENKAENALNYLMGKFAFPTWNKLVKKIVYDKVVWLNENFPTAAEDRFQCAQICYHSNSGFVLQEQLYFFTNNKKSITRSNAGGSRAKQISSSLTVYENLFKILTDKLNNEIDKKRFTYIFANEICLLKVKYLCCFGKRKRETYNNIFVLKFHNEFHEFAKPHIKFLLNLAGKNFELPARIYFPILLFFHRIIKKEYWFNLLQKTDYLSKGDK
ncbi:glycosyl transferase [Fibrobacterales bacterium]|nr:glycosyl transferase [Fibrobacterales bacterium]